MQVKEIMTRNPDTCATNSLCSEAARKMREDNVGSLPVCDENGKCVGIVTDRDIVCQACAQNKEASATQVRDCMSSPVKACHEDDSVEEAAQKMGQNQVRRLLVLDRNENLVGIVALADIATRGSQEAAARALNAISQP